MPGRPPEARLIRERRLRLDLSAREAARRARISEGSWRRTEGPRDLTRTPATIARMAQVTGITPAELESRGRPDAARVLAGLPPPQQPDGAAPVTRDELNALMAQVAELTAIVAAQNPRTREDPHEEDNGGPVRRRA